MSRQTAIAASFAAALLGVFIWTWLASVRLSNETALLVDGGRNGEAVALTEDAQSPVLTQETPEPDGAPPQKQTAAGPVADTDPYKFEKWQDAANHLAELMGLEYDALLAAGKDSKTARIQAYNDVQRRIFEDNEDPALTAALQQYLPAVNAPPAELAKRMPLSEYGSVQFLVRAGRLPQSALKQGYLTLPNGERYHFDMDEEVIVRWQTRSIAAETDRGKKMIAMLLEFRKVWEAELAKPSGDARAERELRQIQAAIENLKTPKLYYHETAMRSGGNEDSEDSVRRRMEARRLNRDSTPPEEFKYDPNPQPSSPELRLTVLDLGLID
ncbi:MAG: hypothetical protein OXT69_04070 [Candidatus Poribacteria bacterium]|nr:hypothetical protein [Candidatus Poribacteria bacterium]